MVKVNRKKLLKEPDEFLTFSGRALAWSKANLRLLLFGGSGVILLLALVLGIQTYLNHRATAASEALGRVFNAYQAVLAGAADQKLSQGAVEGLEKVAQEYGATLSGQQARLALGNLFAHLGEYQKAQKVFQGLLEEAGLPGDLQALAYLGMGLAWEGLQKYGEAAEAFASAAKAAGPSLAAQAGMEQARALEAAGDKAGAERLYRAMLKAGANRGQGPGARLRLAAMGLDPEEMLSAPELPTSKK